MKHWRQWLVVGILAASSLPGAARAESEVDILLNKLVEKGTLTGVEAGQIRREISETKEERNKQIAKEIVPDSSRNWKWKGDIRLRNENRNRSIGTGAGDFSRQRIRFRYGFEAKVNDQIKVGSRLATGSTSDPTSTNQSFQTAFNHKTIVLDRAWVEYAPEIPGISKFKVTGGIIENPFWLVGPLVWDDDLNFDGVATHVEQEVGPVTLFNNAGLFSLTNDVSKEEAALWSLQGGAVFQPFKTEVEAEEIVKNFKITGALAYHDYMNVTNPVSEQGATSTIATAGGTKGNSSTLQDINIINPSFEVGSQYADVPFSLFGDMMHNTAASQGENGFMIGVKVGKARIPFDLLKGWEAGYFFERIDPDSTFGAFTDSDFGNGGTNHVGSVYWLKFAVLKNSTIGFKYFNTEEVKGTKNKADTMQLDWVTAF